ncbi:MAG: efflux transporter outer membrane subunit [Verrucomicrobiales bacterium]
MKHEQRTDAPRTDAPVRATAGRIAVTAVAAPLLACLLSGCPVVKPEAAAKAVEAPARFKGGGQSGETPRARWWTLFDDPYLNGLIERIDGENLELRAGLARIGQAYAALGISRSDLVPNLDGTGEVQRIRRSENDQGGGSGFRTEPGGEGALGFQSSGGGGNPYTQYRAGLALGWEIDLWGRVRYLVDAGAADAAAVERATEDLRLSLQGQLARNYFTLRFLDEEQRVLQEAVQTRRDNLKVATDRFEGGGTGELDVARAETELSTTRADLARLAGSRTRLENAIAVLAGTQPSNFEIPRRPPAARLPEVRAGLPIQVLENRPDVAEAVARLEAANARIGVAKAEFFPRVNLVGTGGLSSIDSNDFLAWSSRYFAIGPEISVPVYQGGRLKANLAGRRAEQEEALADYQQTVLAAFRDVEDALADLAAYRDERAATLAAVRSSKRALSLSRRRYEEGLVSSIEVIDAIREQLAAERRAVQVRGLQYVSTVELIQAIGGGMSSQHAK